MKRPIQDKLKVCKIKYLIKISFDRSLELSSRLKKSLITTTSVHCSKIINQRINQKRFYCCKSFFNFLVVKVINRHVYKLIYNYL